jgi:hypothetical protein
MRWRRWAGRPVPHPTWTSPPMGVCSRKRCTCLTKSLARHAVTGDGQRSPSGHTAHLGDAACSSSCSVSIASCKHCHTESTVRFCAICAAAAQGCELGVSEDQAGGHLREHPARVQNAHERRLEQPLAGLDSLVSLGLRTGHKGGGWRSADCATISSRTLSILTARLMLSISADICANRDPHRVIRARRKRALVAVLTVDGA